MRLVAKWKLCPFFLRYRSCDQDGRSAVHLQDRRSRRDLRAQLGDWKSILGSARADEQHVQSLAASSGRESARRRGVHPFWFVGFLGSWRSRVRLRLARRSYDRHREEAQRRRYHRHGASRRANEVHLSRQNSRFQRARPQGRANMRGRGTTTRLQRRGSTFPSRNSVILVNNFKIWIRIV